MTSIGDIAFMVHGFSEGKRYLAVLFGFFDGSYGKDGPEKSRIISVAGFIAPQETWERFSDQWWAIVRNPALPSILSRFHAFDCTHHVGEFENWKFADRLGLWGDLARLLIESRLIAIHAVLVREHFEELGKNIRRRIGSPYHLPVEGVMQFGIGLVQESSPSEEVGFVFDVENQPIAEISQQRYLNYIRDPNWNRSLAAVVQSSSKRWAPLQAADMLAYGGYRHYLKKFYPETPDIDFPLPPVFTRLVSQIENTGGVYERTALSKIAQQIKVREGMKMKGNSELSVFNEAIDTNLKANPAKAKAEMEEDKRHHEKPRKAKKQVLLKKGN